MREWKHWIDVKAHIKDEDSAQKVSAGVLQEIERLQVKKVFKEDAELQLIADDFEYLSDDPDATDDQFNKVLERFYDWADENDVWMGL